MCSNLEDNCFMLGLIGLHVYMHFEPDHRQALSFVNDYSGHNHLQKTTLVAWVRFIMGR